MMSTSNRKGRIAPSLMGIGSVLVGEDLTQRMCRFVAKHGAKEAQRLLGVSNQTFASARDRGRMKPVTRDGIIATLDRLGEA